MSTAIIPFNHQPGGQLPAHIVAAFADEESNMGGRASIDQLSYRGKIWRVVLKGEEHILQRTNGETGEIEPLGIVSLVVLDQNKNRSRSFYPGSYEDGKNTPPTCYSADGVTPDASVKEPQAATCASCPNSVKGSKITENGKQTTACSPFKRIAVVPSTRIAGHAAMLLRIAQTSVWDKDNGENEAKGWYAWDQYTDMLRARGAKHTAAVETRVKFDIRTPYPKLLFSASRWLSEEETAQVKAKLVADTDVIETILTGGGNDGAANATPQKTDTPAAAPVATKAAAPAAAPAVSAADEDGFGAAGDAAPATAPAAAPKPPPKPPAPLPAPWPPEGWTVHPDDPTYFYSGEDVLTEAELRAKFAPPVVPKAPAVPRTPAKGKGKTNPPAAAPAVEKVQAEGVDDGFGASAPAPAAAATPTAATPVIEGTPEGLKGLLEGWDA